MTNQIVELTKVIRLWRYDGDPQAFSLENSNLRLFFETAWIDSENVVYQSEINYEPIVDSIANFDLIEEFQSIQLKTASLLPEPIDNGDALPEGFTRKVRIWRYQGSVSNGEINTTQLEFCLNSVLVNLEDNVYNPEYLDNVGGNIIDLDILNEFQSINTKLAAFLNNQIETKTIELKPVTQIWRYQGVTVPNGDILATIAEFYIRKGLQDIASGELYKVEDVPTLIGTPDELGLLPEYQALQGKLQITLESLV